MKTGRSSPEPTSRNGLPMDHRISADAPSRDHTASVSSRTSCDDISIEECERLVLSPPPVPMNIDEVCAAVSAAAQRSNSSRTHSIKTQQHEGSGDTCDNHSENDLSKISRRRTPSRLIEATGTRPFSSWRLFLCCCSPLAGPVKRTNITPNVHASEENFRTNDVSPPGPTATKTSKGKKSRKLRMWSSKKHTESTNCPAPKLRTESHKDPCFPSSIEPSGSLASDSRYSPTGSVSPSHRAVLPTTVLSALEAKTAHASVSSTPSRLTYSETIPSRLSPAPLSSKTRFSYPFSFPRFTGHKHLPAPTSASAELAAVDYSGSSPTDCPANYSETRNLSGHALAHAQGSYEPVSWDDCDTVDNTVSPSDIIQHTYTLLGNDKSSAQGDSSDNLEMASPGMDLLGELPADCVNKKCLVIDLDETLVHSWFKHVDNASFVVPVELDGVKHQIYVCKRPHLDAFLNAIGSLFECVMFTASLRKYADPVCDYIDKACHFRHRLFREACVLHQNNLIKDLSRLGRDMDQVCILDNSPVSFLFQPNNALQIVSWFDDPTDQALLELIPYLQGLAKSDTVIDYLREFQPPASAAVAQPQTPSWLLLFNSGASNESDENEGSENMNDVGYNYSGEAVVLSPHFHSPVSGSLAVTSLLVRPYPNPSEQSTNSQLPPHRVTMSPSPTPATTTSFIHQATKPETHTSYLGHATIPLEVQNAQR
ncbi:unnamed protein product [Dicrocoelium dendriticum]|nr:unnamed protein product [Dicrocoelium dendriticum]